MKKKRVFIIISVYVFMLTGVVLFLKLQNESSNHVVQEESTTQQNVVQDNSVEPDVGTQNTEQQNPVSSEEPTTPEQSVTSEQPTTSTQMDEVKETPTEKINTGTLSVGTHTSVAEQSYYQYASLSETEKAIYRVIVQAIKASDTLVNLSKYSCSQNTLSKIYECILADYPQFFYLSKNCSYTYDSNKQVAGQLILTYTDGTTTDQYHEQGERIVTANRSIISEQVSNFHAKISEVLATIPSSGSELEKEKAIYDFIQNNVTYDTQAATLIYSPEGTQIPHAYDVYGALCEGKAVCEGYAKLFQYLCYCVGIQATQVYGTSSNQPHMWNSVKIGNEWYMCDITWDDTGREELRCYNYFNLTTNQITSDHSINSTSLKVPSCHSETYAFYNHYALYINDISTAPENYQQVIDNLVKNGGKHLCVYLGNQNGAMEDYFVTQILNSDSAVQQYISSMNYAIALDNQYIQAGNYGYIPLK